MPKVCIRFIVLVFRKPFALQQTPCWCGLAKETIVRIIYRLKIHIAQPVWLEYSFDLAHRLRNVGLGHEKDGIERIGTTERLAGKGHVAHVAAQDVERHTLLPAKLLRLGQRFLCNLDAIRSVPVLVEQRKRRGRTACAAI